jgi:pimeloyl-ACP methyl ester carboxylesterase
MTATASEQQFNKPSLLLTLTEGHRAIADGASAMLLPGLLASVPKVDNRAVMVIPGFGASDKSTAVLRRYLGRLGYDVYGWNLGTNLGPRGNTAEAMLEQLLKIHQQHDHPISLVGQSLGGIFAREISKAYPEKIRQVISLGSPFGDIHGEGSVPAKVYHFLNEQTAINEREALTDVPPVPVCAVYSKADGIVDWKSCLQKRGHDKVENIEVSTSHMGMAINPLVMYLVADRLAQCVDNWQPFERKGWRKLAYPSMQLSSFS